jgi:hypothetical protein
MTYTKDTLTNTIRYEKLEEYDEHVQHRVKCLNNSHELLRGSIPYNNSTISRTNSMSCDLKQLTAAALTSEITSRILCYIL